MATNDTIIRSPVDTASPAAPFQVTKYPIKVTIYPEADLTAGEFADLQEEDPAGTFQDVFDPFFKGTGGQVRLDTTVTSFVVEAPGSYQLEFDNPTNAVGAFIKEVRTGKA